MDAFGKRCIRAIMRRVHPDLFSQYALERQRNSESLKVLNRYIDEICRGLPPTAAEVDFYVMENNQIVLVRAELPSYGSLANLFYAFGLISEEELSNASSKFADAESDTNFLEWLRDTVTKAVQTAEEHEALKTRIRELRMLLEVKFELASIQLGGEFAISMAEQKRQLEAMKEFDKMASKMTIDRPGLFAGFHIRLYHQDSCPMQTSTFFEDDGTFTVKTGPIPSFTGDDGVLHIVANRKTMRQDLEMLDLKRARLLSKLSEFWVMRQRALTPRLKQLLGVTNVWCDGRSDQSQQKFVLWAGSILSAREDIEHALYGRSFSFSLLVHCDQAAPFVDFLSSSSVLQVRADCQPAVLLEFLASEAGAAADEQAGFARDLNTEEQDLLEQVRSAFGAKHVIRVCSAYDQVKVIEAAKRLLLYAKVISASVDLRGASIAIDDCYELWESGFISIPYDFELSELKPNLRRLLQPSPGSIEAPKDDDVDPFGADYGRSGGYSGGSYSGCGYDGDGYGSKLPSSNGSGQLSGIGGGERTRIARPPTDAQQGVVLNNDLLPAGSAASGSAGNGTSASAGAGGSASASAGGCDISSDSSSSSNAVAPRSPSWQRAAAPGRSYLADLSCSSVLPPASRPSHPNPRTCGTGLAAALPPPSAPRPRPPCRPLTGRLTCSRGSSIGKRW